MRTVLHIEAVPFSAAGLEAVVEIEVGERGEVSSYIVEVGALAQVYQICLFRKVRIFVVEEVILDRFAAIECYISHSDEALFLFLIAGFGKAQRAAFVDRNLEVFVRLGTMDDGIKDEFVVRIDTESVVFEHASVGEHAGIEGDIVKFSCEVEGSVSVDIIVE